MQCLGWEREMGKRLVQLLAIVMGPMMIESRIVGVTVALGVEDVAFHHVRSRRIDVR